MGKNNAMRASARRAGLLVAAFLLVEGHASALPATPQDEVHGFYGALLATMRTGPSLGARGRYARLEPVVNQLFDVPFMTRLATGPAWSTLSPAQQQQLTAAFGRYIAATYADRFDSYSGERLDVTGQQPSGGNIIVETRIVKSDGKPVAINYLMHQSGSGWRIADVYLDGTISQLATQRSEFDAILRQQGVDGLISRLNRKADFLARTS